MDSLKTDWPVYLSSAAIVVTLLTWLAKWMGLMPAGGSTLVEVIAFGVALPVYLREMLIRLKDAGRI